MNRLFLFAAVLLGLRLPGFAQLLPNGGFETWTATGDRALNWLTTDDILLATLGLPIPTGTISKTTDAYAGSFAARVEMKEVAPFGVFPVIWYWVPSSTSRAAGLVACRLRAGPPPCSRATS